MYKKRLIKTLKVQKILLRNIRNITDIDNTELM